MVEWQQYERRVFELFCEKYPNHELLYNQKVRGRHSKVLRQVDIMIRIADVEIIGIFDCKHFNKKVNVKTVDSMIGFMDDTDAQFGGIISKMGFSKGAQNRANAARIKLDVIPFTSVEVLVDEFVPSLDFSNSRNSMYIPLIF